MSPKRKLSAKNKDYCKRYREKNSKKYKENDAFRKRYTRMLAKANNPLLHEETENECRLSSVSFFLFFFTTVIFFSFFPHFVIFFHFFFLNFKQKKLDDLYAIDNKLHMSKICIYG